MSEHYKKKIFSLEVLKKHLDKNFDEKKIILCHGVFDLLHIGHIKYLEDAKKNGDILVVTITPDKYVNKGPDRPIFNQSLRAEALAALQSVNFVAINKWTTAIETIEFLKPDFYIKGPDYSDSKKDVTNNIQKEKKAIKKVKGKFLTTDTEVFSSSNLINKSFSNLNSTQKDFLKRVKKNFSINDIDLIIDSLRAEKVVAIGEAIIDEYVYCETVGKSGKDPFLVSKRLRSESYPGGILAVGNNLSSFVKKIKILSYLGSFNSFKTFILKNLKKNVDLEYIAKSNSPTIQKTRFIDTYSNSKMSGIYDINDEVIDSINEKKLSRKIEIACSKKHMALIVDYGHGLITDSLISSAKRNAKFLAVNYQLNSFNRGFYNLNKYKNADFLCIHEGELRQNFRKRSEELKKLVKTLSKNLKSKYIAITRGNKGALVFHQGKFYEAPAFANKIVDRVGAGDSMLSILSLCFSKGIDVELSLLISSIAAADNISNHGNKKTLDKVNLKKTITALMK